MAFAMRLSALLQSCPCFLYTVAGLTYNINIKREISFHEHTVGYIGHWPMALSPQLYKKELMNEYVRFANRQFSSTIQCHTKIWATECEPMYVHFRTGLFISQLSTQTDRESRVLRCLFMIIANIFRASAWSGLSLWINPPDVLFYL